VLSIKGTTIGLAITAGIHYGKTGAAPLPVAVNKGESLEPAQLTAIERREVEETQARQPLDFPRQNAPGTAWPA
jgi:hypothetical protein